MDDMSDAGGKYGHDHPDRRINKTWIAAGVVVACLAAALTWNVVKPDHTPKQSTAQTSTSPASSSPTSGGSNLPSGPFGVRSDGVAFGQGATMKALDQLTPIGWPPTCAGAVNAAATTLVALTNAVPGVDLGTTKARPGQARPGLKETIDYLLQGDPQKDKHSEYAWPTADYGVKTDITSGGYKVVDCTPGKTATVQLFNCSTWVGNNPDLPELAGKSVCGTDTYRMQWGGDPLDWRVTEGPVTRLPAPEDQGPAISAPLSQAQRRAVLSRLEGWREWANAPR